jgi:glycine oxidase
MSKPDHIAIIGAGIVGCSIAWALSKRGFRISLFDEHSEPLKGISSAGFGSLTPFSDPYYRGEARNFAAKSVEIYRNDWLADLSSISGQAITFHDHGLLQLCRDTKDIAQAEDVVRELKDTKHPARMLDVSETRALEPHLTGDFLASLWLNEPWLDRDEYFAALSKVISIANSVDKYYSCTVRAISTGDHNLTVSCSASHSIHCDGVVVCNGLHPDHIEGIPTIPLKWIRGDAIAMHTTNGRSLLKRHVYLHEGFITPRAHSEMLLGATYHVEALPSENSRKHRDRIALEQFQNLIASNLTILPALAKCEVGKVWRNWRPAPADDYPILGALPDNKRIIIANGFIGLGLTLAPAVADTVADYFSTANAMAFPRCFATDRPKLRQ